MRRVLLTINNLDTAGMKYVLADIVRNIDKKSFLSQLALTKKQSQNLKGNLNIHVKYMN